MALLILIFWVVLNGRVTWEIVGLGAAVTVLTMAFLCFACDWSMKKELKFYRVLPLVAGYGLTVVWEIVKANLAMMPLIFGGKPDPVVRVIETKLKTRFGKMALSNSITLTPGTITLACHENELTVHCLTRKLAEGLDHTVFEEKLERIEVTLLG